MAKKPRDMDGEIIEPVYKTMKRKPDSYSDERAQEILARISIGESIRHICRDEHMPSNAQLRHWIISNVEGFRERYVRAIEGRCMFLVEECLEIADDTSGDFLVDENGRPITNGAAVQRSRLQVETRKWLLSKLIPRFADKPEAMINSNSNQDDASSWEKSNMPGKTQTRIQIEFIKGPETPKFGDDDAVDIQDVLTDTYDNDE